MKNLKPNKLLPLLLLLASTANAQVPDRIRAIHFNKGKVERIYMAPGLATALTFPCDLDEATVGRDEDLKAKVSPTSKKQLTLFLNSSASVPTNMIVRCGDKQELFVFDVVPSKSIHQDVLRITGSYGGASAKQADLKLIDSDETKRNEHEARKEKRRIDPSKVVIMESSESWKPKSKKPVVIERSKPETYIAPQPRAVAEVATPVATTPELQALENRRPTVFMASKPELIETQTRDEIREELKRSVTQKEIVGVK